MAERRRDEALPSSASRRKARLAVGLLFAAASAFASGVETALILMSAALFCAYGTGSWNWALGATLAPPDAVASLEAIQNVGGSLGGALAPLLTGLIVERSGSSTPAFLGAAVIAALPGMSCALVRDDAYADLSGPGGVAGAAPP